MLAKRLPLLLAFAAGSLGTAFVGFGREETGATAAPQPQRTSQPVFAPTSAPPPPTSAPEDDAPEQSTVAHDLARADEAASEAGNSLAEVLMRLEASYRQAVAAEPSPVEAPVAHAPATSNDEDVAEAAVEPASAPVATPAAPVVVAATEPATRSPRPLPAKAPEVTADNARIARAPEHSPPGDVHIGDVHQNIYLGEVHQGDLLQVAQLHQAQQLAILQYMQLIALSSQAKQAPSRRAQTAPGPISRRPQPFSTSLTNPDNPWGFDFPPTVLVK